jgi:hypothetical protein
MIYARSGCVAPSSARSIVCQTRIRRRSRNSSPGTFSVTESTNYFIFYEALRRLFLFLEFLR